MFAMIVVCSYNTVLDHCDVLAGVRRKTEWVRTMQGKSAADVSFLFRTLNNDKYATQFQWHYSNYRLYVNYFTPIRTVVNTSGLASRVTVLQLRSTIHSQARY